MGRGGIGTGLAVIKEGNSLQANIVGGDIIYFSFGERGGRSKRTLVPLFGRGKGTSACEQTCVCQIRNEFLRLQTVLLHRRSFSGNRICAFFYIVTLALPLWLFSGFFF